ncbi:Uncharacterised protein [Pseudomonas aeruginosa]|nr:Uncharacterised protein [Pseudomonas aeruginosa]
MSFEKNHFSYLHGVVQSRTTIRAVAQIDQLTATGSGQRHPDQVESLVAAASGVQPGLVLHAHGDPEGFRVVAASSLIYMGPDGHMGLRHRQRR